MRLTPVESSSIAAIGYDRVRREAHVRFRESGLTYVYERVPEPMFAALAAAPSKGGFFNTVFKPQGYAFRRDA